MDGVGVRVVNCVYNGPRFVEVDKSDGIGRANEVIEVGLEPITGRIDVADGELRVTVKTCVGKGFIDLTGRARARPIIGGRRGIFVKTVHSKRRLNCVLTLASREYLSFRY